MSDNSFGVVEGLVNILGLAGLPLVLGPIASGTLWITGLHPEPGFSAFTVFIFGAGVVLLGMSLSFHYYYGEHLVSNPPTEASGRCRKCRVPIDSGTRCRRHGVDGVPVDAAPERRERQ